MTDLNKLLERVREAKGPDRELDIAFWLVFEPDAADKYAAGKVPLPWAWNVSESIDASLALVARLLPGWEYVLEGGKRHRCVLLHPGNEEGEGVFVETAPTLPLAILAALLTALKEVR